MLEELRILSPTAILGYGFPRNSFEKGMAQKPHVIAVDAGSTDPGPYYLGSGHSFTDNQAVKRDLEIMLPAAKSAGIPVIIGSAGGAGGLWHGKISLPWPQTAAHVDSGKHDVPGFFNHYSCVSTAGHLGTCQYRQQAAFSDLCYSASGRR